jgi:hypothetical protein
MVLFNFDLSRTLNALDVGNDNLQKIREAWDLASQQEREATAQKAILDDLSPFLSLNPENTQPGFLSTQLSSGPSDNRIQRRVEQQFYQRTDYFSITYYDKYLGSPRNFAFSLLPAIENTIRPSVQGQTVPGVTPGIMIHTKMRHRAVLIPGSTPIYQSIGLESVEIRLCGLFTGNENPLAPRGKSSLFTDTAEANVVSGYDVAQFFRENIVIPGTPVELNIFASSGHIDVTGGSLSELEQRAGLIHITGTLLVSELRTFTARASRDYYCIDGYLINYKLEKRADPEGTGASADIKACLQKAEQYKKDKALAKETAAAQTKALAGPGTVSIPVSETRRALDVYTADIKSGPGSEFQTVTTLKHGDRLQLTGQLNNGWAQLADGNWIQATYVKFSAPNVGPGVIGTGGSTLPPFDPNCLRILKNANVDVSQLNNNLEEPPTEKPPASELDGDGSSMVIKGVGPFSLNIRKTGLNSDEITKQLQSLGTSATLIRTTSKDSVSVGPLDNTTANSLYAKYEAAQFTIHIYTSEPQGAPSATR